MFVSLFTSLLLFLTPNVGVWQNSFYGSLIREVTYPVFPHTILNNIDDYSLTFSSYAGAKDPGEKYYYVLHDIPSVPTWLFLIRHDNLIKNELWHHGFHFDTPCNVSRGDKILLHIQTVGFIKTDIIFQIKYSVQNTKIGVVVTAEIDKTFPSPKILDFKMMLWAFPHPSIKNLVIIASQGYIKTSYKVNLLNNHIKWHIDNILQNFGDRLTVVK